MADQYIFFNRLEPSPSTEGMDQLDLAARVRDPMWMLCRQWQMGEFDGEDAGSLAYAQVSFTRGTFQNVILGGTRSVVYNDATNTRTSLLNGTQKALATNSPAEKQCLAEPVEPTLLLRVELGQVFEDKLAEECPTRLGEAIAWFRSACALEEPSSRFGLIERWGPLDPNLEKLAETLDLFDPMDASSTELLGITLGRAGDGYKALALAKAGALPPGSGLDQELSQAILSALSSLLTWSNEVYGEVGFADPSAWTPDHLSYSLQATAQLGNKQYRFDVYPDEDGALQWSSFDIATEPTDVTAGADETKVVIPTHVRFPGMPSPRFWDFEEGDFSAMHIDAEDRDVGIKLLALNFVLSGCEDWYVFPLDAPTGSLTRVNSIVVTDVFGTTRTISSANAGAGTGFARWNMFSVTQPRANPSDPGLGNFLIVPPSSGAATMRMAPIEDVRFVRDELANLVWAIEKATSTPAGEARPGPERDTAVEGAIPWPNQPSSDTTSPLRYQLQSRVPAHWIPFVGVKPTAEPWLILEEAAMLRPRTLQSGGLEAVLVPPAGKILKPKLGTPTSPYRVEVEEVPRSGTIIQRALFRARWTDGSTHVWLARRRLGGTGEGNSELRFDSAIPTK